MRKLENLFKNNDIVGLKFSKNIVYYNNGAVHICVNQSAMTNGMTGDQIWEILTKINYSLKRYPGKIPLIIHIGKTEFVDKLVYVMLECICYYIVGVLRRKIVLQMDCTFGIWTEGILASPLKYLQDGNYNQFCKSFRFDINGNHYRRVVLYDENDDESPSKIMQEIGYFLKYADVCIEDVSILVEVIIELVGNAGEHGKSDCLIDIDITESNYTKMEGSKDEHYYGMNVTIVSFSEIPFYEPLQNRMSKSELLPDRYRDVILAEKNHGVCYSKDYSQKDFYIISSFQDKISGSFKKNNAGGTGLTFLINSLEESAEDEYCYMATEKRILFFKKEYMKYNKEGWIGFNESGNYIESIPDLKCFGEGKTFVPGTAFNLGFVIRKV